MSTVAELSALKAAYEAAAEAAETAEIASRAAFKRETRARADAMRSGTYDPKAQMRYREATKRAQAASAEAHAILEPHRAAYYAARWPER
jgi:hypothetical protein